MKGTLAVLLIAAATLEPQTPMRLMPETRHIARPVIDSTQLEAATLRAQIAKQQHKETASCLYAWFHRPDSLLVIATVEEAQNIQADSTQVRYDCPLNAGFVGFMHSHFGVSPEHFCRPSFEPSRSRPDDFQNMLYDDRVLIEYVLCDNGYVFWQIKDGRFDLFPWHPW